MEIMDIGVVFKVGTQKELELAEKSLNSMFNPVTLERSTFFLFIANENMYLDCRKITEKFNARYGFDGGIKFLTVYMEKKVFNSEIAIQYFEKEKPRYIYVWNGEKMYSDELNNLIRQYIDFPHAGMIESENGLMTKYQLFKDFYLTKGDFIKQLTSLGYRTYKLSKRED